MKLTFREAFRKSLTVALREDSRAFLMGEDVGAYGGCYAVSKGLLQEFGPERIRDTPLSELAFVGMGIGAALKGLRPIVEVMTVNFSLLAMDQIINNAATLRHMSGGQYRVPLILRMATGAGRQVAAQHSHSFEAFFAHVPGLKVVTPGTIDDAFGMLLSALQEPNPTVILEHTLLYPMEAEWAEEASPVDLDTARIRRPGNDVTVITWGGSLHKALAAAGELEKQGIDTEVIDLRVLRPLDTRTFVDSVRRTHRAVVVDEGWKTAGLSAEIAAQVTEGAFAELLLPVARVCSAEVPIPYAKHLEEAALPSVARIVQAVKEVVHG